MFPPSQKVKKKIFQARARVAAALSNEFWEQLGWYCTASHARARTHTRPAVLVCDCELPCDACAHRSGSTFVLAEVNMACLTPEISKKTHWLEQSLVGTLKRDNGDNYFPNDQLTFWQATVWTVCFLVLKHFSQHGGGLCPVSTALTLLYLAWRLTCDQISKDFNNMFFSVFILLCIACDLLH